MSSRAVGDKSRSIATTGGVNMVLSFTTGGVVCAENRSTNRQAAVATVYDIMIQIDVF